MCSNRSSAEAGYNSKRAVTVHPEVLLHGTMTASLNVYLNISSVAADHVDKDGDDGYHKQQVDEPTRSVANKTNEPGNYQYHGNDV